LPFPPFFFCDISSEELLESELFGHILIFPFSRDIEDRDGEFKEADVGHLSF